MNAHHWEKLRNNWQDLLNQKSEYLLPPLYQKHILSERDYDEISNLSPNHKRMNALLWKLRTKPAQTNCFSEFISELERVSSWLAQAINNTETKSDPSLTAAVDPSILDGEASKVLRRCFSSQKKSQTSLQDIRTCLENNEVFKDQCEWKNQKLIRFVKEEFVGVEFDKKAKLFMNLGIHSIKCSLHTPGRLSNAPSLPESDRSGDAVAKCTTPNLGQHKCISEKNGLLSKGKISRTRSLPYKSQKKTKAGVNGVDRQWSLPTKPTAVHCQINGRTLLPQNCCTPLGKKTSHGTGNQQGASRRLFCSTAHNPKEKSDISAYSLCCNGDKTKNLCTKFKVNSDIEMHHMKLLPFLSLVEPSDVYLQGHHLSLPCCRKLGKLTPIRNFLVPDSIEASSIYLYVALEIVKFAAACLNNRQNGTVYFGVKSDKKVYGLEAEIVGVQLTEKKLANILNRALQNSFATKFKEKVKETIRDPRFVPVDSQDGRLTDLFVVEVDVLPDSQVVGSKIFWTKSNLQNEGRKEKNLYSFSNFGLPVPVQFKKFKKIHGSHVEARLREENEISQSASYVRRRNKVFIFSVIFLFAVFFCYLLVWFDF